MSKYHSSKVFQFCAIIIISSLCVLLDTLTRIHFNKVDLPKNRPEYNAYGVDGSVFNQTGKILYRLVSKEAWEYPSDERIFLKKLNLYIYDKTSNVVKYQIISDDGWVNHDAKIGELGKNAVAIVNNLEPKKVITIYGNDINLNLDKNLFTSSNDVKALQGQSVVTGHGFSYDSDREFLTLNSKVRVTYVQ